VSSGTVAATAVFGGLQSPVGMALAGLFALLLLAATWSDIRSRRIPNVINAMILLGGITLAVAEPLRARSPLDAVAGAATGLAIWLLFYVVGVLGAGDVKFFAAASAWLGPDLSRSCVRFRSLMRWTE
jgi:prepilin peptidase CpaA